MHNVKFGAKYTDQSLGVISATPVIIQITVTENMDSSDDEDYENLSGDGPWSGQNDTCEVSTDTGGTSGGNGPWVVTDSYGGTFSGNGSWIGGNTSLSDCGDGNTSSGNGNWTVRIPRRTNTNNGLLVLGQTATPPNDAIVRFHEGIEHALQRQIVKNKALATRYGYTEGQDISRFAWSTADFFARIFGYVNKNGKEIRVVKPDIAAYELQLRGNKLTIYEYYDNKIVNIQQLTDALRSNYDFEYYFQKR